MIRGMRARVHGRVQGVGFRFFVAREAERLGVRGYARNLSDGSVEVVATGGATALSALLLRLGQGPRGGSVDSVEHADLDPVPEFEAFDIRI